MPKKGKNRKNEFLLLLLLATLLLSVFLFLRAPFEKDRAGLACQPLDLSGKFDSREKVAIFDGQRLSAPREPHSLVESVLPASYEGERWIEVDLSEQRLIAWEGDKVFLETPVSTGLAWWPTPTGEFRIWIKLRATKMEGGQGSNYYYLPNVPYVMFFENEQVPGYRGYGFHGTYWHSDFGRPRSHGCVNLPTSVAEKLFYWASPTLPEGKYVVRAGETNLGTRVVIHD